MYIGIDCSLAVGERAGIGQYSYNLVQALSMVDRENQYILYPFFYHIFNTNYKDVELPYMGNFKVAFKNIPIPPNLLRRLWFNDIPSIFKEYMLGRVDIVHDTTFCAPRFRNKKKKLVVTIHDITVLTHPECHINGNIKHCLAGIKNAVKYANAIIAVSNHTKQDLINCLKVPQELITVTHLAAAPDYKPVDNPEILKVVRDKYNLPQDYILFIGSLEPRKNVYTLLQAYSRLPDRLRKGFFLVIAGARGWLNKEIPQIMQDLGISNRVHFAGYIAQEDICAVYSSAAVFVYPSLYEGFGLPVLEAMSCGTPVITSSTSSMPEVAGDAAKFISPTDVEELVDVLEYVLENERVRNDMCLKGLKHAAEFSWEKCARETLEVYKNVTDGCLSTL